MKRKIYLAFVLALLVALTVSSAALAMGGPGGNGNGGADFLYFHFPDPERVLALEFVMVHVTESVPEYATEQARGLAPAQEREAATAGVDANQSKY